MADFKADGWYCDLADGKAVDLKLAKALREHLHRYNLKNALYYDVSKGWPIDKKTTTKEQRESGANSRDRLSEETLATRFNDWLIIPGHKKNLDHPPLLPRITSREVAAATTAAKIAVNAATQIEPKVTRGGAAVVSSQSSTKSRKRRTSENVSQDVPADSENESESNSVVDLVDSGTNDKVSSHISDRTSLLSGSNWGFGGKSIKENIG